MVGSPPLGARRPGARPGSGAPFNVGARRGPGNRRFQKTEHLVDLFDKCRNFTRAREVMDAGLYPYFRAISSGQDTEVTIKGQRLIMIGSNNYLGLTSDPRVIEASRQALERFGVGCTGSRFMNG